MRLGAYSHCHSTVKLPGLIDFTIRKIGHVTTEIFNYKEGDRMFIRGPYGNGFDIERYKNKELVIVAGGTGVSPVRGVIEYFADHMIRASKAPFPKIEVWKI